VSYRGENGAISRFHHGTWSSWDNLGDVPIRSVYAISEDREGILWVATDAGVGRWDGSAWTATVPDGSHPGSGVINVFADSGGRVWAGHDPFSCGVLLPACG